ncbi:TonB-dependent receptor plug domain-containing protein [Halopseudomonas pelagia]|uniref:TonB-dependent receptor n=1 Tax=Halopseudomonas pelagia TaxID=553151 RepID=A0AA91Z6Y5_9GAMM|nr:TonB-dependent receptor [Halopseudomonas pelagia]PCD00250.1 TonB-dependent receptor [Halopseudomonas pelagia]QFY56910.1 TonB-dependent receptor [Halopseudomonas pelagia]
MMASHLKYPLLPLLCMLASTPATAMDDLTLGDTELPSVLSATRLKQSPAEVPGSMTVIDRDLIRASGARDIPEILRLVPGMKVGYLSGHSANVNYHGTNTTEARRMQVLVDGRSVYRPGLATVDWTDIPLAIEDIERIEVFRGPNTVTYGANALMGVINIISTRPELAQGTRLKITQGDRGVKDLYGSQGFKFGNSLARLSVFGKEDSGFDSDDEGNDFRDGRRLNAFNMLGDTTLSASQSLSWQFGAKEGTSQRANDYSVLAEGVEDSPFLYDQTILSHNPDSDMTSRDYFAQLHWKNDLSADHRLDIKTYVQHMERLADWRACDSPIVFSPELRELYQLGSVFPRRINDILTDKNGVWGDPVFAKNYLMTRDNMPEEYWPVIEGVVAEHAAARNGEPACWDLNENLRETRYEVEIQNTMQLADNLRTVFGGSMRYDQADSDTLFGGQVNNHIGQLFGNIEYRPHHRWLLHAGVMAEEDKLSGFSLSPRIAAHFFIQPTHSLRAVYSEAVRSPDMYENNAQWTYTADNLSGPVSGSNQYYAVAKGPGNLKQEEMRSYEVGYNGYFHQLGLSIDIKGFYDEIRNMISQPLQIVNFVPDNSSFSRFTGAESQLDWKLTNDDRLRLTYAYVDFVASNRLDQRLTARNSGSAAWLRQWPGKIESSLIYYGADMLNERRFERLDSRIAKRFDLSNSSSLNLALTWQYRLDDEGLTWPENQFNSPSHYYLSAELNF